MPQAWSAMLSRAIGVLLGPETLTLSWLPKEIAH